MNVRIPPGIDPELRRAATLQPALDYSDARGARAGLARALRLSRALAPVPADGFTVLERRIARPPAADLPIRIYEPVPRAAALPALVFFHGGGFVAGDLDSEHPRCAALARSAGVVVVSVGYRLAPEDPFPAAADDGYDALVWVHANAGALGVDPGRLAVGGASAGGGIAASVALRARDEDGPPIALQLLLYPVLDDRLATPSMAAFGDTPGWNGRNSVHMWRHYLGAAHGSEDVPPYAAPARARDLTGLPPAFVLAAEFDPLRDEAREYVARLVRAGVPVEALEPPGTFHGFDVAVPGAAVSVETMRRQAGALARLASGTPVAPTGAAARG